MMFPRIVAKLDSKPAECCADHKAAFVAAKVIEQTPTASCFAVVASR